MTQVRLRYEVVRCNIGLNADDTTTSAFDNGHHPASKPPTKELMTTMAIRRNHLLGAAGLAVVLFIVANPLGDRHHGLGKHSHFVADLGQTFFVLSLLTFVAFVLLCIAAGVQRLRNR